MPQSIWLLTRAWNSLFLSLAISAHSILISADLPTPTQNAQIQDNQDCIERLHSQPSSKTMKQSAQTNLTVPPFPTPSPPNALLWKSKSSRMARLTVFNSMLKDIFNSFSSLPNSRQSLYLMWSWLFLAAPSAAFTLLIALRLPVCDLLGSGSLCLRSSHPLSSVKPLLARRYPS